MTTQDRSVIPIDLTQSHVWVVARVDCIPARDEALGDIISWHILGVYTKKDQAHARCSQQNDCVLALPLDVDLPDEIVGVDNEEFPLAEVANANTSKI